MIDRGIIKWAPFNSVVPTIGIVKELSKEKNKLKMPILSEDQIDDIRSKIINSYSLKEVVNIKYFENGYYKNIEGIINYIDEYEKKIWINNNYIYFIQIINISN